MPPDDPPPQPLIAVPAAPAASAGAAGALAAEVIAAREALAATALARAAALQADHEADRHARQAEADGRITAARQAIAAAATAREAGQIPSDRASREAALAAQIQAARRGVLDPAARATAPASPATDPALAAMCQAQRDALIRGAVEADAARAASYIAPPPSSSATLDAAIGAVAVRVESSRTGAAARARNPKIHEADYRDPKISTDGWLARVRRACGDNRKLGDPLDPVIRDVAGVLSSRWRQRERGTRITLQGIAAAARVCVETVRKAVRCLQAWRLLDVVNVMTRRQVGGRTRVERGANAYMPAPAPAPGSVSEDRPDQGARRERRPPPDWADICARTLATWSPVFGAAIRAHGFRPIDPRRSG
jgi:hypothetical protein